MASSAEGESEPVPGTQVGTDRDGEPEYLCAVEGCGHVSTEKFGRLVETDEGERWFCFIDVDEGEEVSE